MHVNREILDGLLAACDRPASRSSPTSEPLPLARARDRGARRPRDPRERAPRAAAARPGPVRRVAAPAAPRRDRRDALVVARRGRRRHAVGRPQRRRDRLPDDHDRHAGALEGEQPGDVRRARERRLDRRRPRPARRAAVARAGGGASPSRPRRPSTSASRRRSTGTRSSTSGATSRARRRRLAAQAAVMLWSPFLSVEADEAGQQGLVRHRAALGRAAFVDRALRARALAARSSRRSTSSTLAALLLGLNTVMAMVFAGTVRYRAPWDFVLALLAAFALERAWELLRERRAGAVRERRSVERLDPVGAAVLREVATRARAPGRPHRGRAPGVARRARGSPPRAHRRHPGGRGAPSRPSSTISGSPPTALAITGRPRSIASSATMPKPSPNDETTTICASSNTGATGATRPRNVTASASRELARPSTEARARAGRRRRSAA